jgi:hypothetical protein
MPPATSEAPANTASSVGAARAGYIRGCERASVAVECDSCGEHKKALAAYVAAVDLLIAAAAADTNPERKASVYSKIKCYLNRAEVLKRACRASDDREETTLAEAFGKGLGLDGADAGAEDLENEPRNADLGNRSDAEGADAGPGSPAIGKPYQVTHVQHVVWNEALCRFEDPRGLLPEAMRRQINRQFGVDLASCPTRTVEGSDYPTAVPAVLCLLKERLAAADGFSAEGVFRIAPPQAHCEAMKRAIDAGEFAWERPEAGDADEAHSAANLIKVWFRNQPPDAKLFASIDRNEIMQADMHSVDHAGAVVAEQLAPAQQSLMLWLLDVMCEVALRKEDNKMTPRALSIVIAPNLGGGIGSAAVSANMSPQDALAGLLFSQKACVLLGKMLVWRLRTKFGHGA